MNDDKTTPFMQHVRRLKKDRRQCLVMANKMDQGVKYLHCLVWFTDKERMHSKPGKHAHDQWIRDDNLEEVRV